MTNLEIGGGATYCGYSDREPYTIIAIEQNGRKVTLQADKAKLLNGFDSGEPDALQFSPGGFCGHVSGTQRYEFTSDPDGRTIVATLRKDGSFRLRGTKDVKVDMRGRRKHYDYNF